MPPRCTATWWLTCRRCLQKPASTASASAMSGWVSYQKPAGGKGPDYPQQVLQALIEGGRSQGGAAIAVDLTLPPGGKLATTDAHVTTRAELNMREKLTLIAAVKRYLLQGSVQPELVDGRAVTANLQTSIV